VLEALKPLEGDRRCYRLVGGVLVERTAAEVLPAVQKNVEGPPPPPSPPEPAARPSPVFFICGPKERNGFSPALLLVALKHSPGSTTPPTICCFL